MKGKKGSKLSTQYDKSLADGHFSIAVTILASKVRAGDLGLAHEARFDFNGAAVTSVAFSPQSDQVAAACSGTILVWSLSEKKLQQRYLDSKTDGRSLAFSPDGRFIGTSTGRNFGTVFRREDPLERHLLPVAEFMNSSAIAFSPRGNYVATGSQGGRVTLTCQTMIITMSWGHSNCGQQWIFIRFRMQSRRHGYPSSPDPRLRLDEHMIVNHCSRVTPRAEHSFNGKPQASESVASPRSIDADACLP